MTQTCNLHYTNGVVYNTLPKCIYFMYRPEYHHSWLDKGYHWVVPQEARSLKLNLAAIKGDIIAPEFL